MFQTKHILLLSTLIAPLTLIACDASYEDIPDDQWLAVAEGASALYLTEDTESCGVFNTDSSCGVAANPTAPTTIEVDDATVATITRTSHDGVLKLDAKHQGKTLAHFEMPNSSEQLAIKVLPVTQATYMFEKEIKADRVAYMPGALMNIQSIYYNHDARLMGDFATPWAHIDGTWRAQNNDRQLNATELKHRQGALVPQAFHVPDEVGVYQLKGRGSNSDISIHVVDDASIERISLCETTQDTPASIECLTFHTTDAILAGGKPALAIEISGDQTCTVNATYHTPSQRWRLDIAPTEAHADQPITCAYTVVVPGAQRGQGISMRLETTLDTRGEIIDTTIATP